MYKIICQLIITIILFSSCQQQQNNEKKVNENESKSIVPTVATIKEAYTTLRDENDNVDSPALWFGSTGEQWLLATAKESNVVFIYDAVTGKKITQFGQFGNKIGDLSRPNGIAVIDDYAVIVERDNHRIQVFSLPELNPIGIFGDSILQFPYGLTIDRFNNEYSIFVTDNYETAEGETPDASNLGKRVHHFTFKIEDNKLDVQHIKAFGETSGKGVLFTVESILVDRTYNRILISDEHEEQRNVKIYNIKGEFTGDIIPYNYFFYEPEGIVLWECERDSSGYYIVVDQGKLTNTFQVFDRKTINYIGGFSGEITRNTDGIAISQQNFGIFNNGAFFPVHNDGSVTAISWDDIAKSLNLKVNCN
jgi:3-phytase